MNHMIGNLFFIFGLPWPRCNRFHLGCHAYDKGVQPCKPSFHGVGLALSWFGGQPFVGHTFPFIAFPKTLAFIDINVL
jgi:hypothetical protein